MFCVVSVISGGCGGATQIGVSVSCTLFTTTAGSGKTVVNSGNMLAGSVASPLPNCGCGTPSSEGGTGAGSTTGGTVMSSEPIGGGGTTGVNSGKVGGAASSMIGCGMPGTEGGEGAGVTGGQPGPSPTAAPARARRGLRRAWRAPWADDQPGAGRTGAAFKGPRQTRVGPTRRPPRRHVGMVPRVRRIEPVTARDHIAGARRRLGDRRLPERRAWDARHHAANGNGPGGKPA